MMSEKFYKKLMEITKVMEEKGEGISYIHNETENYTIGTKKYNEEIATLSRQNSRFLGRQ